MRCKSSLKTQHPGKLEGSMFVQFDCHFPAYHHSSILFEGNVTMTFQGMCLKNKQIDLP